MLTVGADDTSQSGKETLFRVSFSSPSPSSRTNWTAVPCKMLSQYHNGDEVEGEITGVVEFGAFMRFGKAPYQMEGLIHISEIDWQIIEDPSQVLKVGDKVKAKIVDLSQGRASLSLKALKEDPWKEVEKRHNKLDVVQGKVTKLNPFGAFVEI